jgi:uncharacterized protein Smg (DUF494 family)
MQERIIEIIVYLLGEFQQQNSQDNYVDISKQLVSRGYTESEINLAFSWVFNHLQRQNAGTSEQFEYSPASNRILHDVEKLVISSEAYGYLIQLRHLGLLSDYELEMVIENSINMNTSTITIDDIKSITASILFDLDSNNSWNGIFFHPGTNTIH